MIPQACYLTHWQCSSVSLWTNNITRCFLRSTKGIRLKTTSTSTKTRKRSLRSKFKGCNILANVFKIRSRSTMPVISNNMLLVLVRYYVLANAMKSSTSSFWFNLGIIHSISALSRVSIWIHWVVNPWLTTRRTETSCSPSSPKT